MIEAERQGNEPSREAGLTLAAKAAGLLRVRGLMRSAELRAEGITPATLTRMTETGELIRPGRGLYRLADAPIESQHDLALAAKRVPRGVICLTSALACHGLTDHMPRRVWVAIGRRDWKPNVARPALRIVRLSDALLGDDVETHAIDGVPVKLFGVARSVVDAFRLESLVGRNLAIESLREALRQRKTTPAALAESAMRVGAWSNVRPYLEALTADA
jgi:predicted transcriptional regulator of viral defense system